MKVQIGKQVNPVNTFAVEVEFMHGDADGYTAEEVHYCHSSTEVEAVLKYFTAHIGMRNYAPSELEDWVPHDLAYGYEFQAYVEAVALFYYDGSGGKHEVTYDLD